MSNLQAAQATSQTTEDVGLLDSIVEQSRIARNDEEHVRAKAYLVN